MIKKMNCKLSSMVNQIEKLEEKLEKFDNDNFIIKVVNRWPKQVMAVIIVGVMLTILAAGYSVYQGHEMLTSITSKITTPK